MAHVLGLSDGPLADRPACARIVAEFCRARGAQATLVFDGPPDAGNLAPGQPSRVRVLFSGARSADDLILGLLARSRTPRDFTVVTSDKSLGDRARHRGAAHEKAHEFARRIGRRGRPPRDEEKPSRRETREEIEAWLKVFTPRVK